jgi:hypothetical protein
MYLSEFFRREGIRGESHGGPVDRGVGRAENTAREVEGPRAAGVA